MFVQIPEHLYDAMLPGTTLHAQAGCGIINMWSDFGRMWKKPAIEKWQAIKVLHLIFSMLYNLHVRNNGIWQHLIP